MKMIIVLPQQNRRNIFPGSCLVSAVSIMQYNIYLLTLKNFVQTLCVNFKSHGIEIEAKSISEIPSPL